MTDGHVTPAVTRLVTELDGVFRDRLRMVATYGDSIHLGEPGPHGRARTHSIAVVSSLSPADLRACAGLAESWMGRGLAVPLLVTTADLGRALDAFPMEFSDIVAQHHTVHGEDLLAGLVIAREDVRRACEAQARSHALHLRESYLECGAHPRSLARLVADSAGPFRLLLARVAMLSGHGASEDASLVQAGVSAGAAPDALRQLLAAARSGSINPADAEALFPSYLEAIECLVQHVDAWRA